MMHSRFHHLVTFVLLLVVVVGCSRLPTERRLLGDHKFANGKKIRVEMFFDYSDPDIAFGGDISVYFEPTGVVEYVGRVLEEPSSFELEKISSDNGECVCFFSKKIDGEQVVVVVDSTDPEGRVFRPLKERGRVKKDWGQQIIEKVCSMLEAEGMAIVTEPED